MKTAADEIRAARKELSDAVISVINRFENTSGARVESINVSWTTEKGTGGLDPDKEVRTIDIQIII